MKLQEHLLAVVDPTEAGDSTLDIASDVVARGGKATVVVLVDQRVRDAIQELPDGYREAVVLYDLEGLTYQEAANLLELTLGRFKTRLHRARLHLRKRLQDFWSAVDTPDDADPSYGGAN